jgi:hypothetical protein
MRKCCWETHSSCIVLATVPFVDHFYYCGSHKTRPQLVRSGFVPHSFLHWVDEYWSHNSMFGIWNMQLWMAHLLVDSDGWYLQNSVSCSQIIAIVGPQTRILGWRLLRMEDIENRRMPKGALYEATSFLYQTLNSLINICHHNAMLRLKNRRFLMG